MSASPCLQHSKVSYFAAMKSDSDIFDSIRVKKGGRRASEETDAGGRVCQHRGCTNKGTHKAPMGRGREGEFYHFCMEHVREYNKSYNYFNGMSDSDLADFREEATTGHRPTWTFSTNGWADVKGGPDPREGRKKSWKPRRHDPHRLFENSAGAASNQTGKKRRQIGTIEHKCFRTMHLDDDAKPDQIKRRYKELVKQHHPDANGGDRSSEDKLREVIQAYNYLKQAGLC